MGKRIKIFIVYFPVILISGQILVNLLYFVAKPLYMASGFYLNTFFGTNVFFAIFLVFFTMYFKFCSVSVWAAWAQLLFAVNFMIVKEDNLYNILFQVIVGILAIILTFKKYLKKFPMCNLSLLLSFLGNIISKGSCKKGLDMWDRGIDKKIIRQHRHGHQ